MGGGILVPMYWMSSSSMISTLFLSESELEVVVAALTGEVKGDNSLGYQAGLLP
jgi:hypothetical protein